MAIQVQIFFLEVSCSSWLKKCPQSVMYLQGSYKFITHVCCTKCEVLYAWLIQVVWVLTSWYQCMLHKLIKSYIDPTCYYKCLLHKSVKSYINSQGRIYFKRRLCPVSFLSCIRPVQYLNCPVSFLSCIHPVLYLNCHVSFCQYKCLLYKVVRSYIDPIC